MISIGDAVVYRHYVCELDGVRKSYREGKDYYDFRALFEKSMHLLIPIDDAKPPLVRSVMTKREALALIDSIVEAETIDESAIEKESNSTAVLERRIEEEYKRYLHTLSPEDIKPVIKSAYLRTSRRENSGKKAATIDKKYLELAEKLLCDELSVSLNMERDKVDEFLVSRIKRSNIREKE